MANANFFSPDGGITRYPLEDTEGRIMYEEEIHGVNLFHYPYVETTKTTNGITFTVKSDGTITANGTASAPAEIILMNDTPALYGGRYIITGCPPEGADNKYRITAYRVNSTDGLSGSVFETGNGLEFEYKNKTGNVQFNVYVHTGQTVSNLVFRPMLRKATIEDSAYRPYNNQAIQNQLNAQGVLGAKNLLPITLSNVTELGVTFTKNDDNSITLNGTASTTLSGRKVSELTPSTLPKGNYILSRKNISQGSDVHFALTKLSASGTYIGNLCEANTTDNVLVTVDYNGYDKIGVIIWIRSGTVLNNYTIYPMLRLASDPDDTYVPFAMTNRELTEVVEGTLTSNTTNVSSVATYTKLLKNGKVCMLNLQFKCSQTTLNQDYEVFTLPSGFEYYDNTNGIIIPTFDTGSNRTEEQHDLRIKGNKITLFLRQEHDTGRWVSANVTYITN